jgi:protein TonB
MSSAYLAPSRAHAHQPDLVRIAALSAAMAVNLTVFLAAMRPLPPMAVLHPATPDLGVRFIPPKAEPAPPPPPPAVQPLHRTHQALPVARPVVPAVRPTDEGTRVAPPVVAPTIAPPAINDVTSPTATAGPPVEASLAYRSAPLHFPAQAIRQHMRGTVLLRVLVDETGKPIEVAIERSSGYLLLDRSAREQVLAGWRFQPARVDGRAVRAWARVPVSFELRQQ